MSNALPQEQLKSLSDLLISTRETAKELLSHPDNQVILASVQSSFNKLLNRVNFLAGITHSAHMADVQFEPIVIDGEAEAIAPAIPAAEADREAFVTKVKELYAQFETLSPEGLLNDFRSTDDQLVLRGVAKLAGIEEYEEAELTEEFIESIQAAIKAKASDDARQKEIDAQLEAEANAAAPQKETSTLEEQEDDQEEELEDDGEDIPIPGIDTPITNEPIAPAIPAGEAPKEATEPTGAQPAPKAGRNTKPKANQGGAA